MPAKKADYVSIVERCYEPVDDDHVWLAALFEAASPLLDIGGGLGLSLVREEPEGRRIVLSQGVGRIRDLLEASWRIIEQVDEATYRRFYYPSQLVVQASHLVTEFAQPVQDLFASTVAIAGAKDLLGMLGYPARGWAFALFVAVGDHPIDAKLRDSLRRLRIHVEASLRLRMFAESHSVAVLRPDGKLECLDEELVGTGAAAELVQQAINIERARSASGRADPHRALAFWQALVAGQWSVVEREDTDGKRYYHAFENAPHAYSHRELTETEALVFGLTLQGLSGKEVAYSTGLSESRISSALAQAAERLGFPNRHELLRVGAALLADEAQPSTAHLTGAEREILELIRAGRSNREIAVARGTSINTVANQIATVLRKTGAGSRRALLVRAEI